MPIDFKTFDHSLFVLFSGNYQIIFTQSFLRFPPWSLGLVLEKFSLNFSRLDLSNWHLDLRDSIPLNIVFLSVQANVT